MRSNDATIAAKKKRLIEGLVLLQQALIPTGDSGAIAFETHKKTQEIRLKDLEKKHRLTPERELETWVVRFNHTRDALAYMSERTDTDIWFRVPVDFRTFVDSEKLLAKRGVLWPKVMDEAQRMNNGRYTEAVLVGGIGVAKTTIALYTQAYQAYVLSCMRDPHTVFDLDPSSEIMTVFQSVNKQVAKDVEYMRFRSMLDESPYFRDVFPYERDRASEIRFIASNIVIRPVAGHDTAAIGQNVIGGILDEMNFMAVIEDSKLSKDGGVYDQATRNYNSIARRRESRFMQMGMLPGMLCLVSSRNYPGQFTDKKEEEARTNPRIFVYDKRLWEIRPERFKGEYFPVFIGDTTRKPRILQPGENVHMNDRHLVMPIPVEYQQTFQNDLLAALRDVAGVATQALHPFMLNTDAVAAAFGKVKSILSRDDTDWVDSKAQVYPKLIRNRTRVGSYGEVALPRVAHIDLAVSNDSAGLAIAHVPAFESIKRGDHVETLPIIEYDEILEIRPPRGGEIIFESIRQHLYNLRKLGLFIKYVSFDTYQSVDSMQILRQQGFIVETKSMDTDTTAYDVLKQAIYDGRVRAPAHTRAQTELVRLEMDTKKHKIDHPPNGSKDCADAMAGCAWWCSTVLEFWHMHQVPLVNMPASLMSAIEKREHTEAKRPEPEGKPYLQRLAESRYAAP